MQYTSCLSGNYLWPRVAEMTQETLGSFFNRISARNAETAIDQTGDTSDSGYSEVEADLQPEGSRDTEDPSSPDFMGTCSDQAATISNSETCTCQCCSKPETPYHPPQVSDSKKAVAHHSKERKGGQLKTYARKIQPSWYGKHPWISVRTSRYKIFCSTCRGAKQLGLLKLCKYQKSVFTEEGFGNWNKALQRFQDHEKSDMHKEATAKIAANLVV